MPIFEGLSRSEPLGEFFRAVCNMILYLSEIICTKFQTSTQKITQTSFFCQLLHVLMVEKSGNFPYRIGDSFVWNIKIDS